MTSKYKNLSFIAAFLATLLCCQCLRLNPGHNSFPNYHERKRSVQYTSVAPSRSDNQISARLYSTPFTSDAKYTSSNKKFVVVTGGVISGIGKGITASSIGVLMKMLNLRPSAIKIDPYINVDAGTMSPFEHGETFVLDDGAETDLDLGNYERFLDVRLTNDSNLTTGKVYQAVIARERKGEYLGKTVQIIPHITNEIIHRILTVAKEPVDDSSESPDVIVIELGGTIGDIESMPFVEAIRQLQLIVKPENLCLVHVSMVPTQGEFGEQKTKPTQHSIKELRGLGLFPDFIVCRSKYPLHTSSREKISLFCNVPKENVLSIYDVSNIYQVPLVMLNQSFHAHLSKRLGLDKLVFAQQSQTIGKRVTFGSEMVGDLGDSVISYPWNEEFKEEWTTVASRMENSVDETTIALVGKYTNQGDAYLSIISAIKHSCISTGQRLNLELIESSQLEEHVKETDPKGYKDAWDALLRSDGIVVPGGFGVRGVEGKIQAIKYARENKVPFLGICLGLQVAVIEYARHILNKSHANSQEFVPNIDEADAAVIFMPEVNREAMVS